MRAADADGAELGLLFWAEVAGIGEQPAGDLPGPGQRRRGIGRGGGLPERGHVAADGPHAAGEAAVLQFGVERGGVGEAFVLPLVNVSPEGVQLGFLADGPAEQLAGAGGAGEPSHGGTAERQGTADRVQ